MAQFLRSRHLDVPSILLLLLLSFSLISLGGCATDLGTGDQVIEELQTDFPITVGRLIQARMDPSRRLRIYLEICEDLGPDGTPVCRENSLRVLAMVEAEKKSLLERIANEYLAAGKEKPVYVYGPLCEGLEEMILVPRCQLALALGVWDPILEDYIVYSTLHGTGSFVESEGFGTFITVTGQATGLMRKAAAMAK